ncbi:transcription factor TFIIF complex subunit Tfg3 [Dimargaris verticillata]|uniref:Protein AF-9 homolog n=1 Tax=Dimargaris verticillata TaxID=2761393 RepID=A0A9W8B701_9FUNG|nr:transcription factor TFIIF complex subunit Tfg3 [Dimargaris verticillata]
MSSPGIITKEITVATSHELPKNAKKVQGIPVRKWSVALADRHPTNGTLRYDLPYVQAVKFELHPTFPDPIRTIRKPPFQLVESGWGEFDLKIHVYFQDPQVPPATFQHDLNFRQKLYEVDYALDIVGPGPSLLPLLDPNYPENPDIHPIKLPAPPATATARGRAKATRKARGGGSSGVGGATLAIRGERAPTPAEIPVNDKANGYNAKTTVTTPAMGHGMVSPSLPGAAEAIARSPLAPSHRNPFSPYSETTGHPDDHRTRTVTAPSPGLFFDTSTSTLSSPGSIFSPPRAPDPLDSRNSDANPHPTMSDNDNGQASVAITGSGSGGEPQYGKGADSAMPDTPNMISINDPQWLRMQQLATRLQILPDTAIWEAVDLVQSHKQPGMFVDESVSGEFHFDLFTLPETLIDQLWVLCDKYLLDQTNETSPSVSAVGGNASSGPLANQSPYNGYNHSSFSPAVK